MLSQDEKQALSLYLRKCTELEDTKALEYKKIRTSLHYVAGEDGKFDYSYNGPGKGPIVVISTIVRQLIADKAPVCFFKICNIVYRELSSNSDVKENRIKFIVSAREHFSNALERCPIKIVIDKTVITPKKIIDVWFNGFMFHSDPAKVDKFEWLMKSQIGPMAENVFIAWIIDSALTAISVAKFIEQEITL